jgi:uncharacterized protein YjdB
MGYTIDNSGDLSYNAISSTYKFTPIVGTEIDVSWPITLSGSLILSIKGDFTFTTNDQHFEISDDANNDITIEGNNKVITISGVNDYGGLVISRSDNTVIQNLGVTSNNSALKYGCGWIGNGILDMAREDFIGFLGTINNCYTTGEINYNGGGITGGGAGDFGTCNINNCYSTGSIIDRAGGICGHLSIYTGTCNIKNCYSTGRVNGNNSGGIIGANLMFSTNPTVLIQNCYSTGIISGVNLADVANSRAGGISGSGATTNCTIENCYVSGAITNGNPSYFVGSNSTCIPQKCSNSTDGLWSDSKASSITGGNTIGLLDNGEWKHVIDNKPWKLKVFFKSTRFVYNATGGNFVYENNIYPISSYENVTKMGLFNNGNIDLTRLVSLDTNTRTKTISGITTIANAKPTTIVLLDSLNNIVDYVDSCTVIAESGAIQYSDIDNKIVFIPETNNGQTAGYVPISWPVIISGTTSISLTGILIFNDINNYLIVESDVSNNVVIKSDNLTQINISNIHNYGGLVYSRSNNTIVKNIGITSSGTTTLADGSGWIGRCNSLIEYSFLGTIDMCYSTHPVINNNCGGIVGTYAGFNGICNINNCYTLGEISGSNCGGIAGSYAGINGVCIVNNCYSIGNITGLYCGGIVGKGAGVYYTYLNTTNTSGNCTITNCYSTGIISGGDNSILNSKAGGIIGSSGTSDCTISNCYVSGNIENDNISYVVGENSSATVNNCSASTNGNWSDSTASYIGGEDILIGLSTSGNIWRNVCQNTPWKLAIFLHTNQYTYNTSNNGTIYYTTENYLFNTYSLPLTLKLSQNGVIYDNTAIVVNKDLFNVEQTNGSLDNDFRIKIQNVTPLANGDLISIILVDGTNTIIGYLDCIRIKTVDESGSIRYNNLTDKFVFTPNGGITPRDIIWPMNLLGDVEIDISEDLVFSDPTNYFTIGSNNNVVINGLNHTININNLPYFKGFVRSGSSNTIVHKICVNNNANTLLYNNGGWIGTDEFIGTITNSYSVGSIQNRGSGGIVGSTAGYKGTCTISNCYSIGDIVGTQSGGIVGAFSGSHTVGICIVKNCFSIGIIDGVENGGIVGAFSGFNVGNSSITNCYSLGDITGPMNGGICGSNIYNCNIVNCYSRGNISGQVADDSSKVAGGIVGYNPTSSCTINNCYVAGNLTNGNPSYIYGKSSSNQTPTVTNCSNSEDGLWYDNIASSTSSGVTTGLLLTENDSVWKKISQNVPWKLKVFTSSVTIFFSEQFNFLTYTNNTFPINIYPTQTSTQLINNGNILGNSTIGIDNSLLYDNVGVIYNSLPTSLVLVDTSNNIIDYIDVFTIYTVSGVVVSPSSMTLNVGQVGLIDVTINPTTAYNKNFTLSSSDINVATVSMVGGVINIYSISPGTTQIRATSVNGGLHGICNVTVLQPVTGISMNNRSLTLVKGAKATLLATVSPNNATDKSVTWSSSNTNVATVNTSGEVTCVSAGSVNIIASSVNNNTLTATCKITVTQPVTGISMNKSSIKLVKGAKATLLATVSPKNATDKRVTWSSSNTKIATINTSGKVTCVSAGSVNIIARSVNNNKLTATCKITVTQPVTGISMNKSSIKLVKGAKATLLATVSPKNATDKRVNWSSSNTKVATVTPNGLITALSPGTATIKVKTVNGIRIATCKVIVN